MIQFNLQEKPIGLFVGLLFAQGFGQNGRQEVADARVRRAAGAWAATGFKQSARGRPAEHFFRRNRFGCGL